MGHKGAAPTATIFARSKRQATLRSVRLTVESVIPSNGLGAFSLRAGQARPRNLYTSLSLLQERLQQEGKANTILVAPAPGSDLDETTLKKALANAVRLAD